jgi:hypothetical protein
MEAYIGAFLLLEDIWEEKTYTVRKCPDPTHGERAATDSTAQFCKWCDKPIEQKTNSIKRKKDLIGKDCEWTDWMYAPDIDLENVIVLIANKYVEGKVSDEHSEQVIEIGSAVRMVCVESFEEKYDDYIRWLRDVQKFKVTTRFGVIKFRY